MINTTPLKIFIDLKSVIYKEFGPIVKELDDHLSHILCVLRVLSFTRGFPPHSATRRCQISGQKTFSKAWYYSCSMLYRREHNVQNSLIIFKMCENNLDLQSKKSQWEFFGFEIFCEIAKSFWIKHKFLV